ncbi:MAG: flagellar hook capping FlgD N-terminal domain-containing protein [Pseudomonadota bacterium]
MSEISPVGTTGTTTGTTATTATATESAISTDQISEDFDTFLQLLTAQIQNQDPLAPLDSTQFVEQLATFSSLEQQVETNQTLTNIELMLNDLHSAAANEWLDQEVAVSSKHVAFEGEPVEFEIDPAYKYDDAVLTVKNSQNQVVWQEQLDANAQRYSWNGEVLDPALSSEQGVYEFQIDLFSNGQPIATTQAEIVSKITAVAHEGGQLKLGTNNYLTTDLDNVRKLTTN